MFFSRVIAAVLSVGLLLDTTHAYPLTLKRPSVQLSNKFYSQALMPVPILTFWRSICRARVAWATRRDLGGLARAQKPTGFKSATPEELQRLFLESKATPIDANIVQEMLLSLQIGEQARDNEFIKAFPDFAKELAQIQRIICLRPEITFHQMPSPVLDPKSGLPIRAGAIQDGRSVRIYFSPQNAIGIFHELYEHVVLPNKYPEDHGRLKSFVPWHTLATLAETAFSDGYITERDRQQVEDMQKVGTDTSSLLDAYPDVQDDIRIKKFSRLSFTPMQVYALRKAAALHQFWEADIQNVLGNEENLITDADIDGPYTKVLINLLVGEYSTTDPSAASETLSPAAIERFMEISNKFVNGSEGERQAIRRQLTTAKDLFIESLRSQSFFESHSERIFQLMGEAHDSVVREMEKYGSIELPLKILRMLNKELRSDVLKNNMSRARKEPLYRQLASYSVLWPAGLSHLWQIALIRHFETVAGVLNTFLNAGNNKAERLAFLQNEGAPLALLLSNWETHRAAIEFLARFDPLTIPSSIFQPKYERRQKIFWYFLPAVHKKLMDKLLDSDRRSKFFVMWALEPSPEFLWVDVKDHYDLKNSNVAKMTEEDEKAASSIAESLLSMWNQPSVGMIPALARQVLMRTHILGWWNDRAAVAIVVAMETLLFGVVGTGVLGNFISKISEDIVSYAIAGVLSGFLFVLAHGTGPLYHWDGKNNQVVLSDRREEKDVHFLVGLSARLRGVFLISLAVFSHLGLPYWASIFFAGLLEWGVHLYRPLLAWRPYDNVIQMRPRPGGEPVQLLASS